VDAHGGANRNAQVYRKLNARFFAVVNPAAGGGRCGQLAAAVLDRVRHAGILVETATTSRPAEASELARNAYARGLRNFLAVGGDGTAYEVVNGLFPEAGANSAGRAALGFLPLGTGNSFLKDFTARGLEDTLEALRLGRRRACDVIRLQHAAGDIYFINLLSLGFPADVGETANRRFKRWGELGYLFGVFARLLNLRHSAFPHRIHDTRAAVAEAGPATASLLPGWDRRACLFLSFSNSKFTGGKMMIAPNADATDGSIEYVRWGPIGRLSLLWNLPRLFTGTHIHHPLAARASAARVEFDLAAPVNALVDGEILRLDCRFLEVLPAALEVIV
jgi:diacylglycerol kinase (ATP)